jgi:hypothetical protein
MKKFVFMVLLAMASKLVFAMVPSSVFASPILKYTDVFGKLITISQISEDSVYSSGDNNKIVMAESESFRTSGKEYGYQFEDSTVIVYIRACGFSSGADKVAATVDSVEVTYNMETTRILSASWSNEQNSYLITFTEDGVMHTEWLNFSSPVFQEVLRLKWVKDDGPIMTKRERMGKLFSEVLNKTTGIKFRSEKR